MGRFAVFRHTTPFGEFRKVVSKIHKKTLEYPCEICIVDACCTAACDEFETWLNEPSKYIEGDHQKI